MAHKAVEGSFVSGLHLVDMHDHDHNKQQVGVWCG